MPNLESFDRDGLGHEEGGDQFTREARGGDIDPGEPVDLTVEELTAVSIRVANNLDTIGKGKILINKE